MKVKRQKKVQRILNFFKHNFGHHAPYQMLLDGTFTQACLSMKVNIKEQLPKYLGELKLLTTKCCILEAEKLGPQLFGATVILKQFSIHKCGHDAEAKPAAKCIKSMLGTDNPNRYFVATQDPELRQRVRKVPGTPVLYLHHSAPVLEKPSAMSEASATSVVEKRLCAQSDTVSRLKQQELGPETAKKKRRKKGGPNPLSCLKKKTKKDALHTTKDKLESAGKKRKRKRKSKTDNK